MGKYEMEEYSNVAQLIKAIKDEKKCPVLAIERPTAAQHARHAVVAFEISKSANGKDCVKCKNSWGQTQSVLEIPLDFTKDSNGWSLENPVEAVYITLTN